MTDYRKMFDDVYKEHVEQFLEEEVRRTALTVARNLVLLTPVDTGRARSNWNADINTIDLTLREAEEGLKAKIPPSSNGPLDRTLLATLKFKLKDTIHISNNLPYIERLNEGHSKQAPAGFIEMAISTGIRPAEELSGKK